MRFVYGAGRAEQELALDISRPDASIANLAAALGAPGQVLYVDGRWTAPESGLAESGLVMGSTVTSTPATAGPGQLSGAVLRVVGGLCAGRSVRLPLGRTVVGRGSAADVVLAAADVSRTHCAVEATADGGIVLTDLASRNGTDVNGSRLTGPTRIGPDDLICLAGEVLVRIVPADWLGPVRHMNPVREARPGGTLPFNRAPRVAVPDGPGPVPIPSPPGDAHKAPFSLAAMLGPIVMAGGIVALTG
ncbi:MAG TPA: FHA domain-containing protein, partial [Mycobacteriales bacterium]|nr:FHA domain-containing protein [Mycobacteriales bacterium]